MANIFAHLPPHRLHNSVTVSPDEALTLLSSYITAASTNAALQPHAILTESGPTSATSGSGSGLTIHNLKRVEAGLRGEQLGEDLSYKDEAAADLLMDGEAEKKKEKKRRRSEVEEVGMGANKEDWVEKDEYERDQEEENVQETDVGGRVRGNADGEEAREMKREAVEGLYENTKADKEARKTAKKQRGKAEKKEREEKRRVKRDE